MNRLEKIRKKWMHRFDDASDTDDGEEEKSSKHYGGGNTRLPYGLCKGAGIDTTGMSPKEAWKAYEGETGISPKEAYESHFGTKKSSDKKIDDTIEKPKHIKEKIADAAKARIEIDNQIYNSRVAMYEKLYPHWPKTDFKDMGRKIRSKAEDGNEDARAYLKNQKELEQKKRDLFKDVRASDCETMDDVKEYAKNKYGLDVTSSMDNIPVERVKSIFDGLDNGYDEFPAVDKGLKRLSTKSASKSGSWGKGEYAHATSGGEINFNPKYFESEDMQKGIDEAVANGHWPKNTSPASIAHHEYAHQIEYFLIKHAKEYDGDGFFGIEKKYDAMNKHREAAKIVSEACKKIKKTSFGKGKTNAELIHSISGYADMNRGETMSEAFADCFANGENANPLSIAIKEAALKRYKEVYDSIDNYD